MDLLRSAEKRPHHVFASSRHDLCCGNRKHEPCVLRMVLMEIGRIIRRQERLMPARTKQCVHAKPERSCRICHRRYDKRR